MMALGSARGTATRRAGAGCSQVITGSRPPGGKSSRPVRPVRSDAVADGNGRIAKAILLGRPDRDLVEELYLGSLSRPPNEAELEKGLKYLQGDAQNGRAARAQDLLWALVNSKAFLYNF